MLGAPVLFDPGLTPYPPPQTAWGGRGIKGVRLAALRWQHCMMLPDVQTAQGETVMTQHFAMELADCGGWAVLDTERKNQPVALGGLLPQGAGRALAWGILSSRWRRNAVAITEIAKRQLDNSGYDRIEVAVKADFPGGHRWAERLGFTMEHPHMERYAHGQPYALYVRLKDG